jgi:hypothetical protein
MGGCAFIPPSDSIKKGETMYDDSLLSNNVRTKKPATTGSLFRSTALLPCSFFLTALLALGLGMASGQSNLAPRSDADLLVRYMTWAVRTQFAGLGMADHVGLNRFIALPTAKSVEMTPDGNTLYVGSIAVTVRPNESLVLPILAYTGEKYAGDQVQYPPDQPNPAEVFTAAPVRVIIDGMPIVESEAGGDLSEYYFGHSVVNGQTSDAYYWPAPIRYKEPLDRGGPIAIAAIWVQGIGIVLPPLPPGEHVIDLTAVFYLGLGVPSVGYHNTFNINVE